MQKSMGHSHNSQGEAEGSNSAAWAVRLLVGSAIAILSLAGCAAATKRSTGGDFGLVDPARPGIPDVGELAQARRAATGFAHSYIEAIRSPAKAAILDATSTLRRDLRALGARLPKAEGSPSLRLLAVALIPRSKARIDATIALAGESVQPFPISFVLNSVDGRWLVTRLPGN